MRNTARATPSSCAACAAIHSAEARHRSKPAIASERHLFAPPPLKAGYLRKKPVRRSLGATKIRWMTLHPDEITWSEAPGMARRGQLSLTGATIKSPSDTDILIESAQKEVLSLAAEDAAEAADWREALSQLEAMSQVNLKTGVRRDGAIYSPNCVCCKGFS